MFSGALFDIVVAPRPQLRRNPASKRFLTFLFFEVTRSQLAASSASSLQSTFRSPLASLAACFPRLAAPLPKNLACAMFSGALFDIVVTPRPQLRRNPASKRFLTFLFFEVARPQLAAGSASSPQSTFRSPLASLAACVLCLRLLFPKTLLTQCFREPFLTSSSLRGRRPTETLLYYSPFFSSFSR